MQENKKFKRVKLRMFKLNILHFLLKEVPKFTVVRKRERPQYWR